MPRSRGVSMRWWCFCISLLLFWLRCRGRYLTLQRPLRPVLLDVCEVRVRIQGQTVQEKANAKFGLFCLNDRSTCADSEQAFCECYSKPPRTSNAAVTGAHSKSR